MIIINNCLSQTNTGKAQGTRCNMNHYKIMRTDTLQQALYAQQETHQTTYMPQIPTLSQESNYAMQTSQTATTSKALFSKAEGSMDSDDNDGRLSRQEKNTPQNHKSDNCEKEYAARNKHPPTSDNNH
jgi:hypothetical protein